MKRFFLKQEFLIVVRFVAIRCHVMKFVFLQKQISGIGAGISKEFELKQS